MVGAKPRRWFGFARDRRGVSAVEFALILPLMLVLFFGGDELGDALSISRKVTHITSSLSDLVTQSKTITNSDMSDIFDAAGAIITPYSSSILKMKVSEIAIDANSKATVAWSDASNDTALTVGSVVTLPAALVQPSTYLVMSEVHYSFKPVVGYVMTGTYDLSDKFYSKPRLSASIARTAS